MLTCFRYSDLIIKPGIQRVQVLADISHSHYVAIAMQPMHWLQIHPILHIYGTPYHFPKLHLGPCSSVACGHGQTDRHRCTWPLYISRRIRLMWNV